jgi:hypothetical protein
MEASRFIGTDDDVGQQWRPTVSEVHLTERKRPNVTQRKPPGRATIPTEERLFVGRSEAAQMLSISCRALDYLIGKKQLNTRRIGSRVLIPMADLLQFCRSDHPARLVG